MELLDGEPHQDDLDPSAFEKVEEFQYLGRLRSREISVRKAKTERVSFALPK